MVLISYLGTCKVNLLSLNSMFFNQKKIIMKDITKITYLLLGLMLSVPLAAQKTYYMDLREVILIRELQINLLPL